MKFKLVNLTEYTITTFTKSGEKVIIPPSGKVAKIKSEYVEFGTINGIPQYKQYFGDIEVDGGEFPQGEEGTIFIVSDFVKKEVLGRGDICSPGKLLQNKDGKVIGCEGLIF